MQTKLAGLALLGASPVNAFRPQLAPVPIPIPGRPPNPPREPIAPENQPRNIQPIHLDKRAPHPKPTLQELLPTQFSGGKHRGLKAYERAFPNLSADFADGGEETSDLHDNLSLFWLKELDAVFKPDATLTEQRHLLDQHLMRSVGKPARNPQNAFLSDNLKGKDLEQSIEYLRLATVALRESFRYDADPGLEHYRRQYNPKDGTDLPQPEITLTPKIEKYLKDNNINPVKVALGVESVLDTRLGRLKSRSQLMQGNSVNRANFLRP